MHKNVGVEERKDEVVGNDDPFEAERFPIFHQARTEVEDEEVVGKVDGQWDLKGAHHWVGRGVGVAMLSPEISQVVV